MWLVLLATCPTDVVDTVEQLWIDVTVVLCGWLPADVGTCRYECFLKAVAQLLGERFLSDAQGDAAVLGNQIGRQVDGVVQNDGRRRRAGPTPLPARCARIVAGVRQNRQGR